MRGIFLALGILAYAFFFVTFLYLIAFTGNLWGPRTVDVGGTMSSMPVALVIDIALIALFGLQHSIMARPAFKRAWTQIVPPPLERSAYVVAASAALVLLFYVWRPMPMVIWQADSPVVAAVIWALFALGWLMVLVSTFLINHFELFGLHQLWRNLRQRPAPPASFREPFLYRWVRHPLYVGFILAFWAIPVMTLGHLVLAIGMTVYIVIAIGYEERDLLAAIGAPYADYRRRVGMLIPGIGRARD